MFVDNYQVKKVLLAILYIYLFISIFTAISLGHISMITIVLIMQIKILLVHVLHLSRLIRRRKNSLICFDSERWRKVTSLKTISNSVEWIWCLNRNKKERKFDQHYRFENLIINCRRVFLSSCRRCSFTLLIGQLNESYGIFFVEFVSIQNKLMINSFQ